MPERSNTGGENRRKRVNTLKKMIILILTVLIIVPILLCIALFYKIEKMEEQIQGLYEAKAMQTEAASAVAAEMIPVMQANQEETDRTYLEETQQQVTLTDEQNQKIHKVYLTFDDGPSSYTDEILDILKKYDVKGTFFVLGKEEEHSRQMYRRIVEEGHTLGMHSYSHQYAQIYASKEAFAEDMLKLQTYLESTTGIRPYLCRFPGGSSNNVSQTDMQELINWMGEQGMVYYDWNISSGDAGHTRLSLDTIVSNCTAAIPEHERAVILMHDAADKHTTVEALPLIIEKILSMEDTVIVPITEETVPVQHVKPIAVSKE